MNFDSHIFSASQFINTHETLIAGLLGVVIGLFGNGYLQRSLHRRQTAHRSNTMLAALIAELKTCRDVYADLCRDIEVGREVWFHNNAGVEIYSALVSQIGELTETQAETILEAYGRHRGVYVTLLPALKNYGLEPQTGTLAEPIPFKVVGDVIFLQNVAGRVCLRLFQHTRDFLSSRIEKLERSRMSRFRKCMSVLTVLVAAMLSSLRPIDFRGGKQGTPAG